ncbi:MAG: four helix bundle protein [Chloroflexi bacterium]|nr:four helix bundle protein [Chloroflexota bacterium]MBU1660796.1 four helix bundle protein [Chloroflexota bacterium]
MSEKPTSFEAWKETVHPSIRNDPLWNFQVYPKALFAYDLAWEDCEYLLKDVRGRKVAEQLIRSVGSISANIEEGYGRGYGKDYAYRLRIALGEARESRGWYWKGHKLFPPEILNHRLNLLNEIVSMLAPNINKQHDYKPK